MFEALIIGFFLLAVALAAIGLVLSFRAPFQPVSVPDVLLPKVVRMDRYDMAGVYLINSVEQEWRERQ